MELLRNGQILLCVLMLFIMITYEIIKRKLPKIYVYPLFLFEGVLSIALIYVFLSFFSKQFILRMFILAGVVMLISFIAFIYAILKKYKNTYFLLLLGIFFLLELASLSYVPMTMISSTLLQLSGVIILSYGIYVYFKNEEYQLLVRLLTLYSLVYLILLYL